jgi:hypothetical protein
MRNLLLAFLLCAAPLSGARADETCPEQMVWPALRQRIESDGWRVIALLQGKDKAAVVWHVNHDIGQPTNWSADAVAVISDPARPAFLHFALIRDDCVDGGARILAGDFARFLVPPSDE